MKTKTIIFSALVAALSMSGCMQSFEPQDSIVTKDQVAKAPKAFNDLVDAVTNDLIGDFPYSGDNSFANDFGLPSMFIRRDVAGQDMFPAYMNWWSSFYTSSGLAPTTAYTQMPWTIYYGWIKSCNIVISMVEGEPTEAQKAGLGIAYAMRAFYYQELAQMYAPKTYAVDKSALTVPIVTEKNHNDNNGLRNNPRATNEVMWAFILDDLNKAEKYLTGYERPATKETPNLQVVYGLKARAYLIMEDWANAQKYAKMAQDGFSPMTGAQYNDRVTGFNTINDSWMLAMAYKPTDPAITQNDGDSSWGSHMINEISNVTSGCGYAANYGQPLCIDRHLFETIPATDARKLCYVDFAIDELPTLTAQEEALKSVTDYPSYVANSGLATWGKQDEKNEDSPVYVGGLILKFRAAGNEHDNQYKAWTVPIPIMRVEEMMLIEAEAAGMQNEAEGIRLLTAFGKLRDPNYVYGTHNEAYFNNSTSAFRNEVWWQRRVEFLGEGLSMYDIKRLQKGIIRSYPNTNHVDLYRWNVETVPQWMTYTIVNTEVNYNPNPNNPTPTHKNENSPEFKF